MKSVSRTRAFGEPELTEHQVNPDSTCGQRKYGDLRVVHGSCSVRSLVDQAKRIRGQHAALVAEDPSIW